MEKLEIELEQIVDRAGFMTVLSVLGQICYGKADHLRSNWQDTDAAASWDEAGKELDRLIASINV